MKVVVDTNVLVSGILSREGPPGKIVDLITGNHLQVCFVGRILAEYEAVLNRPEFTLPGPLVANLLAQIVAVGESVSVFPLSHPLPHEADEMFLEAALAGGAECLITGNLKHFPTASCHGVRVLSPRGFLEFYADQQAGGAGKIKSPSAKYRVKRKLRNRKSLSGTAKFP